MVVPRRWILLASLLLICLIPRLWAAWNWDILCSDAIAFVESANALQHGDVEGAFGELGLNTYPVILAGLHQSGLPWTVAGKWWSVAMATLAVLPLFGWVRRQFDDQIAVVACLLYVMQGRLVAFSPLTIRDPTFWLLLNLTLYLTWRAIVEIRWWLFLAAGAVLTLAVHTRTEGWVLLVPLLLWSAFRLSAVAGRRARLVAGTLTCLAVIPFSIVLVNVACLSDAPRWELFRAAHVDIAHRWFQSFDGPVAGEAAALQHAPQIDPNSAPTRPTLSGFTLGRKLTVRWVKTYTYVYGLLGLLGLWGWWRVYFRRDHQVLLLVGVLLLGAIWVRYSQTPINMRYFLPVVLVSLPWIALGFLWVPEGIISLTERHFAWSPGRRAALIAGLLLTVAAVESFDSKLSSGPLMHQKAALGKWILHNLGPNKQIIGSLKAMRLVKYYSQGRLVDYPDYRECVGEPLLHAIEARRPEVVLLWRDEKSLDGWGTYADILSRKAELGYRRVLPGCLPPGCQEILVLVRSDGRF